MKQPTAEDVLAAIETARFLREVFDDDQRQPDESPVFADMMRSTHVIHRWLDQFDDAEAD